MTFFFRISFVFVFGFNFSNKSRYLFGRWLLFSLLLLLLLLVLISHKIRLFAFKYFVKDDEICIFVKVKVLIVLVFDRELCIQLLYFVLGCVCLRILPEKCIFFATFFLFLSFLNINYPPLWSGWNAPRSILLSFHITVFTHFVHSTEWFHQWIERSAHHNLKKIFFINSIHISIKDKAHFQTIFFSASFFVSFACCRLTVVGRGFSTCYK